MFENTLTFDGAAATVTATVIDPPVALATADGGERQPPTVGRDSGSIPAAKRPLRRWSVADLIARSVLANDR